jgi:hypothetical protein
MISKICFLFLSFTFLMNVVAQNELSDDMKFVVQSLNINMENINRDLSIEKPMRYLPEMMAFAILEKKSSSMNGEEFDHYTYDCHVVMYNASDKKITNKYTMVGLESDAIRLSEMNFDFAPYKVKSDLRAFGLRIKYSGPSRVNQYEEEKITLFIPEKDKLTPILKDYSSYLYTGEWDTNCAGEFHSKRAYFIMQTEQINGYFGIQVNLKKVKTVNTPIGDDCDSKETASKNTDFLVYKDGVYQMKK